MSSAITLSGIAGKSGGKITHRGGGLYTVFQRGFRQDAFAVIDFGAARFEDAVEDGAGVGVGVHEGEIVC